MQHLYELSAHPAMSPQKLKNEAKNGGLMYPYLQILGPDLKVEFKFLNRRLFLPQFVVPVLDSRYNFLPLHVQCVQLSLRARKTKNKGLINPRRDF